MDITERSCYQIDIPGAFEREDFQEFLERAVQYNHRPKENVATWHTGGTPGEGSDVRLVVGDVSY